MRVFVFGGMGFIGRRVIRQLAAAGHEVFCLDIRSIPGLFEDLGSAVTVLRADLTQFDDTVSAIAKYKPDVVINLSYLIGEHDPHVALKLNVLGMDNCFEAARICEVDRVVFTSSIAVHGNPSHYGDRAVTEADTPHPSHQYGYHKVYNEWHARQYIEKNGMTITCVRVSNVAAPDKVLGSVEHVDIITKSARGEAVHLPYGDFTRCIIYVDDMADMIVRVAEKPRPAKPIYNSGGYTLQMQQIAAMVRDQIPEAKITFANAAGSPQKWAFNIDNSSVLSEFNISLPPYEDRIADMIKTVRSSKAI